MRKLLLIVVVLFLPLQWTAAALAEYCQHNETPAAQAHFGHHEHAECAKPDADDKDTSQAGHSDCASCLAHCFHVALPEEVSVPPALQQEGSTRYIAYIAEPVPFELFRPPLSILA